MEDSAKQFEQLFSSHSDAIFRHLYYRLGDRERAKELTQEVFMRTWQHIAAGKPITFERAFLYKVARNLFINEIRSKKETQSLDVLTEEAEATIPSDVVSPETFTEQQELLHFISQLPDAYKEVLVLRYIDDFAVKDIASMLGEKETNISMRIIRATDKLRKIYYQE